MANNTTRRARISMPSDFNYPRNPSLYEALNPWTGPTQREISHQNAFENTINLSAATFPMALHK